MTLTDRALRLERWLLSRRWLWKLTIFDNGAAGGIYHRYDHLFLPYSQGMGNNGVHGSKTTAIKWVLEEFDKRNHINGSKYE